MSSVAVVVSGLAGSSASKSDTDTPGTGAFEVSSVTRPDADEVPVVAPASWAAAICSARSRSAADMPTSLDSARVITRPKTVTAASSPTSAIPPRAITGRWMKVADAAASLSSRAAPSGRFVSASSR